MNYGVVVKVRPLGHQYEYLITNGNESITVFINERFNQGEGLFFENGIWKKSPEIYDKVVSNITVEGDLKYLPEGMKDRVLDFARELKIAKILNKRVGIRFHGDADGITSALIINKILRINSSQHHGVFYRPKDAIRDLEQNYDLLLLLDFGSSKESQDGLKIIESESKVLIIDHHPPENSNSLNPWNFNHDSRITTGVICGELAQLFGIDCELEMKISCAADKSDYLKPSEDHKKTALALDYAAMHSAGNLKFYQKIISKESLRDALYLEAKEKVDSVVEKTKIKTTGNIAYFNLDDLVKKGEWPPPGKVTTEIFERYSFDAVIGKVKKTLILRSSNLNLLQVIERIKSMFGDIIESGGGHKKAGSIRVKEGFEEDVLNQLVALLKNRNT